MVKRIYFVFVIVLLFGIHPTNAQESAPSIMEEVSYVYIEKLIAIAKENHPRLKAHNSNIKISESALQSAKLSWFSPLSLSYVYSPSTTLNLENPTFFRGYQVGFNVNLGTVLQTPTNIKRAKEDLKIDHYERDEYLLQLTTEVKTRYFTYLKTLKSLKLNAKAVIDAQNLLTKTKYQFEKGEASLEEYSNITSMYSTLTETKLELEVNFLTARASLEELLGVKLEAIPN